MDVRGVTRARIALQHSSGREGCQPGQVKFCTGGKVRSEISLGNLKDLCDAEMVKSSHLVGVTPVATQ